MSNQIDIVLGMIARTASERGCRLSKIRLVKFLYLLDLFSAQAVGKTLTEWPWAFVHYGPYCRESTDAIDRATRRGYLAAAAYESKYGDEDYRLYGPGDQLREDELEATQRALPIYVLSNLMHEVHRWCDDTYGLLNYVYFHTGPMRRAMPGEALSFAGEEKPDLKKFQPVKMLPLTSASKAALREVLAKMKAQDVEFRPPPEIYDQVYFEALENQDDDGTPVGVSGEAQIQRQRPTDD